MKGFHPIWFFVISLALAVSWLALPTLFPNINLAPGGDLSKLGSTSLGQTGESATAGTTECAPPQGMISWWNGNTFGPSPGNAVDIVDGNNGGMSDANIQTLEAKVSGLAFEFNGIDQYIQVPDANNLDVTSITIEGWVKPQQTGNILPIITKDRTYSVFISPEGNLRFLIFNDPEVASSDGDLFINFNEWNHIAVVYSAVNGFVTYVNGNKGTQSGDTTGPILSSEHDLLIGKGGGPVRYFKGLIDELSIYDRALFPAEIQAIYQAGSAGKCLPIECVAPPEGLVSWWDGTFLDQEDVCTTPDILDGNNGVCWNTAEFEFFTPNGFVGDGYNFDGIDDNIKIPDANNLDVTSITMEAWVNPSSLKFQGIISKGANKDEVDGGYTLYLLSDGTLGCRLGFESATSGVLGITSISQVPLGTWTHVACTYDALSGISVYVNGGLEKDLSTDPHQIKSNALDIYIGRTHTPVVDYFKGFIDELSIYSRALTPAEIQSIYLASSAGKCIPEEPPTFNNFRVFTTSTNTYNGNLGGLQGADTKCQTLADSTGLGGVWMAWLSDRELSVSDRFYHSTVPYRLLDGTLIANDWNDLKDGTIQNSISLDENGNPVNIYTFIMTSTTENGDFVPLPTFDCNQWRSDSTGEGMILGRVGFSNRSDWTNYATRWCSEFLGNEQSKLSLYCFEQPSICGNGILEFVEECDDGNSINTDSCANDCKLTYCGDGIIQQGEECDDGNEDAFDQCRSCRFTYCGDGLKQTPNGAGDNEECDDGNNDDSDTCTSECKRAYCGDGIIQQGEECDLTNFGGKSCTYFGFNSGYLGCGPTTCKISTSNCRNNPPGGGGPSSFLGKIEIMTLEGNREIRDLEVGDVVISYNEESGELEPSELINVFVREVDIYLVINRELEVTANHPMYINEKWTEIGKAEVGDMLKTIDEEVRINSIEVISEVVEVYNLEVEGNHNYYAGGYLAHNKPAKVGTAFSPPLEGEVSFSESVVGKALSKTLDWLKKLFT